MITSIFPTGVLYAQLYMWQIAVESYLKENQERESAESSRDVLTVDLERVTHDAKRFSEQVMVERVFFFLEMVNIVSLNIFTWFCILKPVC